MKRHLVFLTIIIIILSYFIQSSQYKKMIASYKNNEASINYKMSGRVVSINSQKSYFIFKPSGFNQKMVRIYYKNVLDLNDAFNSNVYHLDVQLAPKNNPIWGTKNEVGFDIDAYLYSNGIIGQYHLEYYTPIKAGHRCFHCHLIGLKSLIKSKILSSYDKHSADFLIALLLSEKDDFEDYSLYKNYGLAHLFAISGLHFGLLYTLLRKFLSLTNRILKSSVIVFLLVLVAIWVGGGYSTLRALFIIIYLEIGNLMNRKPDSYMAISISALVILFLKPFAILSSSFQLSYYAFFIIAIVMKHFKYNFMVQSLIVQILMLPASLYHFHEINFYSFILNAMLIPFMGIILPFGLLDTFFISLNIDLIRIPLITVNQFLLSVFKTVVTFFPEAPSTLTWFKPMDYGMAWVTIGLCFLFSCLYTSRKHIHHMYISFVLLVMLLLDCRQLMYPTFFVRITDVGHGDMSVITNQNSTIVIDTGHKFFDAVNYLRALGIYKIDVLIITHAHNDHYGNFDKIINAFDVKMIYTTQETIDLFDLEKDVAIASVKHPIYLEVSNMFIDLYPVFSDIDTNDNAVLVALNHGNLSGFYAADVSGAVLDTVLLKKPINFLKVSHHGSKTGYSQLFFKNNIMDYGIISCSTKYNLPNLEIIDLLNEKLIEYNTTYLKGENIIDNAGRVKTHIK